MAHIGRTLAVAMLCSSSALVAACGGDDTTPGTGLQDAGMQDQTAPTDSGPGTPDGAADAAVDASGDAAVWTCASPNELGSYTVALTGAGCGDLAANAPQCITAGATQCDVQLVSQGGSAGSALNGTVTPDMNGDFTNGAIQEGTLNRTGCTGTWNPSSSQLTVDCGGVGSSQSCIATLTRISNTCP